MISHLVSIITGTARTSVAHTVSKLQYKGKSTPKQTRARPGFSSIWRLTGRVPARCAIVSRAHADPLVPAVHGSVLDDVIVVP